MEHMRLETVLVALLAALAINAKTTAQTDGKSLYEARKWAAFSQQAAREQEQATLAAYRGLPDQALERSRHSVLSHERDSIFHTAYGSWHPGGVIL
jgi:hypothetical protein